MSTRLGRITFFVLLGVVFVVLPFSPLQAKRPSFKAKTDDLSVDDRCEVFRKSRFSKNLYFFTISSRGALRRGFDYEVDISTLEYETLWAYFNYSGEAKRKLEIKIKNSEVLSYFLKVLLESQQLRDHSYKVKGEILEALAYDMLLKSEEFLSHFSGQVELFITGGVSYFNSNGRTLGELDVVVGNHSTCQVLAVGEVKLGRSIGKARKQLRRFKDFLN